MLPFAPKAAWGVSFCREDDADDADSIGDVNCGMDDCKVLKLTFAADVVVVTALGVVDGGGDINPVEGCWETGDVFDTDDDDDDAEDDSANDDDDDDAAPESVREGVMDVVMVSELLLLLLLLLLLSLLSSPGE